MKTFYTTVKGVLGARKIGKCEHKMFETEKKFGGYKMASIFWRKKMLQLKYWKRAKYPSADEQPQEEVICLPKCVWGCASCPTH